MNSLNRIQDLRLTVLTPLAETRMTSCSRAIGYAPPAAGLAIKGEFVDGYEASRQAAVISLASTGSTLPW